MINACNRIPERKVDLLYLVVAFIGTVKLKATGE
jgi:hypothetical protein